MALFEYQAIDKSGRTKKGKVDAASVKQATAKLKGMGLRPLAISSAKDKKHRSEPSGKNSRSSIPSKVITGFTRQMSVLISTGIPYDKALEILIEESENATFQHVLADIRGRVIEGSSLAAALQPRVNLFSKMYVAMVRAGEAGGTLGQVMSKLADSREEQEELVSKIQGAMIYPAIMSLLGLGIVIFMITFIIPKIVPIFQQFDIDLPLPTRIVLGTSNFISSNWIMLVFVSVLFLVFAYRFTKSRTGEKLVDTILLKLPFIGSLIRKIVVFRFTETLGTLLISGVELKQSLEIVKFVVGNRVFEDKFEQIIIDITKKGMDLSQALRKTGAFPLMATQMIRVGEESSTLEEMLERIAIIQEKEVKRSLEKSIALLEPIMILLMALSVGFIVMAVMLPMFKLNQLI
ncbi:type II secretion system F family protein [bacterium]|nr:type II secretion system F family protein [bacterium]